MGGTSSKKSHNLDIAYDYRIFEQQYALLVPEEMTAKQHRIQSIRKSPSEYDREALLTEYKEMNVIDIHQCTKSNKSPSIRCYAVDALVLYYMERKEKQMSEEERKQVCDYIGSKKQEDNLSCMSTENECKDEEVSCFEVLLFDSLTSMMFDVEKVSVSEGLNANIQFVYEVVFHHVLDCLSLKLRRELSAFVYRQWKSGKGWSSSCNVMFLKLLTANARFENTGDSQKVGMIDISYQYCKEFYEQNVILAESMPTRQEPHLDILPVVAMYGKDMDISLIDTYLRKGPREAKDWFQAMEAVEFFPHAVFWDGYLTEFCKKIYRHISLVNGETIQPSMLGDDDNDDDAKDDVKLGGEESQEEKNTAIERIMSMEGNKNESEEVPKGGDQVLKRQQDVSMRNVNALIDESQFYDIEVQLRFISTLCGYAVKNRVEYENKVSGYLDNLLDITKGKSHAGYYENNSKALLLSLPLHPCMSNIILRVWSDYNQINWKYAACVLSGWHDWQAFRTFLLGTHPAKGSKVVQKLDKKEKILKKIYSFLGTRGFEFGSVLVGDENNILWWSPIDENDSHLQITLDGVVDIFMMLHVTKNPKRNLLYQQFQERHNSKIVETCVTPVLKPFYGDVNINSN